MIYENIILGGGAAGLFCCANIDKNCKKTLLIEGNKRLGIKVLASGSGQCNLTHGGDIKDFINKYGENGKKIRKVLYKFSNLKTSEFFERHGLSLFEREDGKIFPKSLRSRDVVDLLEEIILKKGIKILKDCMIDKIHLAQPSNNDISNAATNENLYVLESNSGEEFKCKKLIIATGGKSFKVTGSNGKLIESMERDEAFNIVVRKMKPSLVPIYIEDYCFQNITGVSIEGASLTLKCGNRKIMDKNDILFTHKNLSGPLIINNSRYMESGTKGEFNFLKNFMDEKNIDENSVRKHLLKKMDNERGFKNTVSEAFNLPKSFVEASILGMFEKGILTEVEKEELLLSKNKQVSIKSINKFINFLIHFPFVVSGNEGFDRAMATSGGVLLSQIDLNTMEHKKHPNLYFMGECLDVDGDTGGYNIQFAFSSGYIVAQHISQ